MLEFTCIEFITGGFQWLLEIVSETTYGKALLRLFLTSSRVFRVCCFDFDSDTLEWSHRNDARTFYASLYTPYVLSPER